MTLKKFMHGGISRTEVFRKKAGGPAVRSRPHTIYFPRTKGPVGAQTTSEALTTRGGWAERLKGARASGGRKNALKLKRAARKMSGY